MGVSGIEGVWMSLRVQGHPQEGARCHPRDVSSTEGMWDATKGTWMALDEDQHPGMPWDRDQPHGDTPSPGLAHWGQLGDAATLSFTLMLLRLTSSRALSLAWICCSVSSTLVGFGGSSGTGLYVSGFTTPGVHAFAWGHQ